MKIQAFVLQGSGYADVCKWLRDFANCELVDKVEHAQLVVFVGGADVSPSLYCEDNVASLTDAERDQFETYVFDTCVFNGTPMFGICRGSQFLHAAMGGRVWQDVTNHGCEHDILDVRTGIVVPDSLSTHHQMVRQSWLTFDTPEEAGFQLVATPSGPDHRSDHYLSGEGMQLEPEAEVEAYFYERNGTNVCGVQSHPEWSQPAFATWAGDLLTDWFGAVEQQKEG